MTAPLAPRTIAKIMRDGRAIAPVEAHDREASAAEGVWLIWGLAGALTWLGVLYELGAL